VSALCVACHEVPSSLSSCRAKRASRFCETSLFCQAWSELRRLKPVTLRRGWANEHHGWQKRAFFVKFSGEGVVDNGGPYRALLVDVISELQHVSNEVSSLRFSVVLWLWLAEL
jgi:hypothetical protein